MSIHTVKAILKYLPDFSDIKKILEENDFHWELCQAAVSLAKTDTDIFYCIEKSGFMWPVFITGVTKFQNTKFLNKIIVHTNNHWNIKTECNKRIKEIGKKNNSNPPRYDDVTTFTLPKKK